MHIDPTLVVALVAFIGGPLSAWLGALTNKVIANTKTMEETKAQLNALANGEGDNKIDKRLAQHGLVSNINNAPQYDGANNMGTTK